MCFQMTPTAPYKPCWGWCRWRASRNSQWTLALKKQSAGKSRGMAGWLYIDLGPKIWDAIIWGGLRNYYKYFRQQMSTSRAIRTSVVGRLEWPVAFPNFNWGCLGGFGSYWVVGWRDCSCATEYFWNFFRQVLIQALMIEAIVSLAA